MTDSPRRRPARILLALLATAAAAVAVVEALWMLLLGLSMAYGNPLGAPDSDWRVAAGVGVGAAAVVFGAGLALLALRRTGLAALGLGAGAALYSALYLGYPGELDTPLLWAALIVPWIAAAVGLALWVARRGRVPAAPQEGSGAAPRPVPTSA